MTKNTGRVGSDEWGSDEWDDANWEDGYGGLPGASSEADAGRYGLLDDFGPDDDLVDASSAPPGGVLSQPDDVLDFLLPLIGPERAGPMALWCALVDAEDRTLPVVLPFAGAPLRPDPGQLRVLVRQLADVLDELYDTREGGGVVFAIVRRAGGDQGEVETAWAASLDRACADVGVRVRAVAAVGRDRARVLRW